MKRKRNVYVTAAALLFVICGVQGVVGSAGPADAGQKKNGSRPARQASGSKNLFKDNCAKCHGLNGRGQTVVGEVVGAPDFTDASWQENAGDKRLRASIIHGRGGMPPFKDKLSPGEVDSLIAYIRGFKK